MKKIFTFIMSLTCLFCLAGCEKDVPVEPNIKMLYGNYTLTDIHWSGLSVDLNDDGTGYWDLLYEFKNKLGYYEPDYTAVVNDGITYSASEPWAENVTAFHISIPYPYMVEVDGAWKCTGIKTLKYTIRAKEDSYSNTHPGFFGDPDNLFLSGIQEISLVIDSYESGTFKVRLRCTLPGVSGGGSKLNEDYLYYEFIKK